MDKTKERILEALEKRVGKLAAFREDLITNQGKGEYYPTCREIAAQISEYAVFAKIINQINGG